MKINPLVRYLTNLYIIVEMPLNTGSYFFIFIFEHALESTAFKKAKQSLVVF